MITKRTLLKSVAAVGAVTVFSGHVTGIEALAQTKLRVRRSVNTMALDDTDLATYRDFVGIMRARQASNPLSWIAFANIHGDANNFKYCPHGDWYFLPWHRGYVDMYERAAAALTGNRSFAMPYWDWTTLRDYPKSFTDPNYKGKPNPLYVPGLGDDPTIVRNPLTGGNALTDALVGPNVIKSIYAQTVYEIFGTSRSVDKSVTPPQVQNNFDPKWIPMGGGNQGILERTPHNNVHNNIGGYMPNTNSPRDPIFMMHHSNIDRIWANWTALGRQNSTDPLWLNMPFTNNYISPTGTPYTRVVKDVLSTQALGYTYDDLPKADNLKIDKDREQSLIALFNPAATAKPRRLKQNVLTAANPATNINLSFAVGAPSVSTFAAPTPATSQTRGIVAIISDIEIGDNVQSIRVFVNASSVNQDTSTSDPHYVTTLAFLKHNGSGAHAGHGKLPSTIVELTETLRGLSQSKELSGDSISVQLLAVPKPGVAIAAVGSVKPASIEIAFI
jgi:tyrosinase